MNLDKNNANNVKLGNFKIWMAKLAVNYVKRGHIKIKMENLHVYPAS